LADVTRVHFDILLKEAGRNAITTEIAQAGEYYYAEDHRKFLDEVAHFPLETQLRLRRASVRLLLTACDMCSGHIRLAVTPDQQYLHKNPYGYCGLGGTGLYRSRAVSQPASNP